MSTQPDKEEGMRASMCVSKCCCLLSTGKKMLQSRGSKRLWDHSSVRRVGRVVQKFELLICGNSWYFHINLPCLFLDKQIGASHYWDSGWRGIRGWPWAVTGEIIALMMAKFPFQEQDQKKFLLMWRNWSIADTSCTPTEDLTSKMELTKMVKRDQPVEDNWWAGWRLRFEGETTPRGRYCYGNLRG